MNNAFDDHWDDESVPEAQVPPEIQEVFAELLGPPPQDSSEAMGMHTAVVWRQAYDHPPLTQVGIVVNEDDASLGVLSVDMRIIPQTKLVAAQQKVFDAHVNALRAKMEALGFLELQGAPEVGVLYFLYQKAVDMTVHDVRTELQNLLREFPN